LLAHTTNSWNLPTISDIPTSCYTLTFDKVFSSLDDTEMALVDGSFSFSSTQMTLTHVIMSFDDRRTLFSKGPTFYFEGEVTGDMISEPVTTARYEFVINFVDDCRTATIDSTSASSVLPAEPREIIWNTDLTYIMTIDAFTDSLDATGNFDIGICGEKVISLDEAQNIAYPATLTLGADPILDTFEIMYD